jgi:hypothetical protein
MTALPAYCPRCKSIFPFRGIEINPGASIGIQNITTNCPVCGFHDAKVTDAIYAANTTAISILYAPESSIPIIERFREIVAAAAKGQITKDEAINRASDLSPRYASLIDKFAALGLPGLVKSAHCWIFWCGPQPLKICDRDRLGSRIPDRAPFRQPRADVARTR